MLVLSLHTCAKQLFSYVMSVLLPECVVRIIGDVHDVSFQEVPT